MTLFAFLFSAFFSYGATIAPVSNNEVLIVGPITASSSDNFSVQFNKVLFLLPEKTPLTIYLNSEGGSLDSAESIVKIIRVAQKYGYEIHTHVPNTKQLENLLGKAYKYGKSDEMDSLVILPSGMPDQSICLSACTIIFAAGDKRSAVADAKFLFHAPSPSETLTQLATNQEIREDMVYYQKMWTDALNSASPRMTKFLVNDLKVLEKGNEFAASADQIHKTFPDYIQEIK